MEVAVRMRELLAEVEEMPAVMLERLVVLRVYCLDFPIG
jgi:hypothetical protein